VITYTAVCKTRADLKFDLSTNGAIAAVFASMNADQISELVAEYVRRYCDKAANAAACAANADALADMAITVAVKCGTTVATGGDARVDANAAGTLAEGTAATDASTVVAAPTCSVKVLISVGEVTTSIAGGASSWFRTQVSSNSAAGVVTNAVTADSETQNDGLTAAASTTSTSPTTSGATELKAGAAIMAFITAAILA